MNSFGIKSRATRRGGIAAAVIVGVLACRAMAAGPASGSDAAEEITRVLLALIVALVASKLGGEVFVRLGQPAVLGELAVGIVVGNLSLAGFHGLDYIKHDQPVEMLSEIGIILLLFQVGLESDLAKMMKVGASSLVVATVGITAPFFLGWGAGAIFLPEAGIYVHIFIGATLTATSVGLTARVFLDLGRLQTQEARIVLGAAVIDDVQGLIILAVVTAVIGAANAGGGAVSTWAVLLIVVKAVVFLVGALVLGRLAAPKVLHVASRMRSSDLLLTTSLGVCFLFGYLGKLIGLAPIVGAFAAGLIFEEVHWRSFTERGERSIDELIKPLVGFLAPIFFFHMGNRVDLTTFARPEVLGFAGVLTLAAILGKQVCGIGVLQKGLDRVSVGIGMIPRGEVGLIFAAIGGRMMLEGRPVVGPAAYSAVVIMVVVTTMITPPLLKWSLSRGERAKTRRESAATRRQRQ